MMWRVYLAVSFVIVAQAGSAPDYRRATPVTVSFEPSGIIAVPLGGIATVVCTTHSSVVAVYPSLDGRMISPGSKREGIDVSASTDNTSCNPDAECVGLTVAVTGLMWLNQSILTCCALLATDTRVCGDNVTIHVVPVSCEPSGIIPVPLGGIATVVCTTHSSVVAVYPSLDGRMISPGSKREGIDISASTDNTSCNPDTECVGLTVAITGLTRLNQSVLTCCALLATNTRVCGDNVTIHVVPESSATSSTSSLPTDAEPSEVLPTSQGSSQVQTEETSITHTLTPVANSGAHSQGGHTQTPPKQEDTNKGLIAAMVVLAGVILVLAVSAIIGAGCLYSKYWVKPRSTSTVESGPENHTQDCSTIIISTPVSQPTHIQAKELKPL